MVQQLSIPEPGDALWSAIIEKFGAVTSVTMAGRSQSTFILHTPGGKLVAKRMRYDRDPEHYFELLTSLAEMSSRFCPRLLDTVAAQNCWYAFFEWISGDCLPFLPSDADFIWRSTLLLLGRMRTCSFLPKWPLESIWLDRLAKQMSNDAAAAFILASLRCSVPDGPRLLTHGDFSLQNFIRSSDGVVLVDWEEVGSAPPGFDAGWMLALARLGYGPPQSHDEMVDAFVDAGLSKSNLSWFETLGLLRLLFRARTLPMTPDHRLLVLPLVQQTVYTRATEMGWQNDSNSPLSAQQS